VDLLPGAAPHRFRANNAANGGVLNLQLDRFREAASIDLYRQEAVPRGFDTRRLPPGRPGEVTRLAGVLGTAAAREKVAAAERLAIFRDRAAVPALVAALRHAMPAQPECYLREHGFEPRPEPEEQRR
jgi:hypothetical protein